MIENGHTPRSLAKISQRTKFLSLTNPEIAPTFAELGGEFSAIPKPNKVSEEFTFAGEPANPYFSLYSGAHLSRERNVDDVSHAFTVIIYVTILLFPIVLVKHC